MTITTTRWDSARHLETEEDIRLYLETCLKEAGDDPAFIAHALSIIARARSMNQLAKDTGLTHEGLFNSLSLDGNPSFSTIAKVTKALGFELTIRPSRTSEAHSVVG